MGQNLSGSQGASLPPVVDRYRKLGWSRSDLHNHLSGENIPSCSGCLSSLSASTQEKLMEFILASQDEETGGFADRPGDYVSPPLSSPDSLLASFMSLVLELTHTHTHTKTIGNCSLFDFPFPPQHTCRLTHSTPCLVWPASHC